jgi:hypothetical protein
VRRSTLGWIALGAAVLLVAGCATMVNVISQNALSTGPNGPETPASDGVPFERVSIPSHSRRLDGYLVRAPADCKNPPAILIYHGFDETISRWVDAQALLWRHCVSSLVFDPSGEGDSTKPASLIHLAEDAPAAWSFAHAHFPTPTRLFVMGHSMGDAVMLAAEPHLRPQPAGVIVADSFASLKSFWAFHGTSPLVLAAMPDWWNNTRAIAKVHVPVLVAQSDADTMTPFGQGQQVYEAANPPKRLAVLHGFRHNAVRFRTNETWWAPVLDFVGSPGVSLQPLTPIPAASPGPAVTGGLADETAREDAVRAAAATLAPSSAPDQIAATQAPPDPLTAAPTPPAQP